MPPPTAPNDPRARAVKLERAGDLEGALTAYQAALARTPDDPDLLANVAGLAARLGMPDAAAKLWDHVAVLDPARLEAVDGQAAALRDLGRFDEAIERLRAALLAHPEEGRLWNSLGVTLLQQGQPGTALTFFEEAARLDPKSATAVYNRGNARFDLADLPAARADFDLARKLARKPSDIATIEFAYSTLLLAMGEVGAGWDAYEARFSRELPGAPVFDLPGRRWRPSDKLEGQHVLVVAEQGVGDEAMFANVLPDLVEALGPQGRLHLAVEPRLVELFARSFPQAVVSAHATDSVGARRRRRAPGAPRSVQIWAPMGSLCRRFRRTAADYPATVGYLKPDAQRVAHWRAWLGAGPPTVGVTWRSGQLLGDRRRLYPPMEDWTPLLRTPGVRFVNLQYGECGEELAAFRSATGAEVLEPPDLDIREQLDDLTALCSALDLIVAAGNATSALAGATGAPLALLRAPASWAGLGTGAYPWYPQVRVLAPSVPGEWAEPMAQAAALAAALTRAER